MRVIVLHDPCEEGARADQTDGLVQAQAIAESLRSLGHSAMPEPAHPERSSLEAAVVRAGAELAVNLSEAPFDRGELAHLVPSLLESLGVPVTGCPSWAINATSCKPAAKRLMRAAGLPTPDWFEVDELRGDGSLSGAWIVKSAWEHASIGLDEDSVCEPRNRAALRERLEALAPRLGLAGFAERFIDGREFNLSLLERPDGRCEPELLPPAEIRFESWSADRPRVVGYRAKWDPESDAAIGTPRSFAFAPSDRGLLERLGGLALECWRLFGLRGYARVDVRVDAAGAPWILEVNANPCLAPDAGFAAAAAQAGLSFDDVVARIVAAASVRTVGAGKVSLR